MTVKPTVPGQMGADIVGRALAHYRAVEVAAAHAGADHIAALQGLLRPADIPGQK